MQAIGLTAVLGFSYAFNSRVLEVTVPYLHIPLLLGFIAGLCALATGNLFQTFKTTGGALYLLLTFWFALGVPFAYWSGGSLGHLKTWIITTLVTWGFITGLTVTYRECKLLLNTVVLSATTAAVLSLAGRGSMDREGRLGLEQGRLSNPNYFALVLLTALPFIWRWFAGEGTSPGLRRLFTAGLGITATMALLQTGSRAGLYGLGVMLILAILRVDLLRKIQIGFAAAVLLVAAFAALPQHLQDRYFTFSSTRGDDFANSFDAQVAGAAAGSTLQREQVFRQSISVTLRNPIFGVGLGNFAPYVHQTYVTLDGKMEAYLGTHNTYTQISSEGGIPALLIFIAIIVTAWRSVARLIRATGHDERAEVRDIRRTACAMQVCLGSFLFFLFFIHMGYDPFPHIMLGLALIVARTGERELNELNAEQAGTADGGNQKGPAAPAGGIPFRRFAGLNSRHNMPVAVLGGGASAPVKQGRTALARGSGGR